MVQQKVKQDDIRIGENIRRIRVSHQYGRIEAAGCPLT